MLTAFHKETPGKRAAYRLLHLTSSSERNNGLTILNHIESSGLLCISVIHPAL